MMGLSILGSVLGVAFKFRQDEVARELLKAKPDINYIDTDMDLFYGLEDITLAIENGNKSEVDRLVSKLFTSDPRKICWNILYIAALKGTADMCEYLIQKGFTTDVDVMQKAIAQLVHFNKTRVISRDFSPLSVALYFKKTENIKVLAKYSNEFVLKKCDNISPEVEPLVLNEIRERLTTKYETQKPRVIAGHWNGRAAFVVYTDSRSPKKIETYCGRQVIIKNPKVIERQHSAMFGNTPTLSKANINIAKSVIDDNGNSLWCAHSNLSMISMSPIKYKDGEAKVIGCCISLFCISKGFIPLGEKEFPTKLYTLDKTISLPVDTQEGYFELCPRYITGESSSYHQRLKMGCLIGNAGGGLNGGGTLGPFVDINGEPGFLTCAHVLFDVSRYPFTYDDQPPSPRVHVVQPAANTFMQNTVFQESADVPCGFVYKAAFDPKQDSEISIDAAAVKISNTDRTPVEGQFSVKTENNLKTEGFDDLPVFNSGLTRDPKDINPWVFVVKFGSTTHLTSGRLVSEGTQVRELFTSLGLVGGPHVPLKNQMEIRDIDSINVFFLPGDSGSAVFTRRDDGSLECIGMAIGRTSNNTTVVTPITAILNELGPNVQLKNFP